MRPQRYTALNHTRNHGRVQSAKLGDAPKSPRIQLDDPDRFVGLVSSLETRNRAPSRQAISCPISQSLIRQRPPFVHATQRPLLVFAAAARIQPRRTLPIFFNAELVQGPVVPVADKVVSVLVEQLLILKR